MIEFIVGLLIALALFLMGSLIQMWKKLTKVLVNGICKLFNFAGKEINLRERNLKLDKSVRANYKEIKSVKKGRLGLRKKRSVNIFALILFAISGTLIIANLDVVSGNMITNWLNELLVKIKIDIGEIDMNTIYTAAVFSVLSFSLTKLLGQWKETIDLRKERRQEKKKKKLLNEMTSDELVTEAAKKDQEKVKQIIEGDK